mmetsp:Transcript_22898/g.52459  ORF Transcript_22898/g.52459 Transcript_22898/m.52459 type:complete len:482 (-) Transcript_22898:202-1647(-)
MTEGAVRVEVQRHRPRQHSATDVDVSKYDMDDRVDKMTKILSENFVQGSATRAQRSYTESNHNSPHRSALKARSSSIAKIFGEESQREMELLCLEYKKRQGSQSELHISMDLSYDESKWGLGWSWFTYTPKLPANVQGEPFGVRPFQLMPASEEVAEDVLKRFGVGALCITGKKESSSWVCQDFVSVSHLRGVGKDGWQVYVVADGHGKYGDLVSDRVVQTLPFFLSSVECRSLLWKGRVEEALRMAFERSEKELYEHAKRENVDLLVSGSTATCVLTWAKSKKIHVATLGDSRAMLFSMYGTVLQSSSKHHPNVPAERERIEAAGGEVREEEQFFGARVFRKGRQFPGLAVSRSFGDRLAKECGVSAIPEVVTWDAPEGAYVLAASDGIWEFLDPEDVAKSLAQELNSGSTPQRALEQLTTMSKGLWFENEGDTVDDTSCVLFPVTSVSAHSPIPINGTVNCWAACCPWFKQPLWTRKRR